MTPEQITRINELCATEIMGWEKKGKSRWIDGDGKTVQFTESSYASHPFSPYENIAHAMDVADKLGRNGMNFVDCIIQGEFSHFDCHLYIYSIDGGEKSSFGSGVSRAAALTLTCLKAKGVDVSEFEK